MIDKEQRDTSRPEPNSRFFYGYVIVVCALFVLFASYGVRFSYGVFFRPMAEELALNSAATSAAYSISMILEGIFSLVSGGLTDRFGPRIVLTFSTVLVALGYCLMPLVHSPWQLYLFYGLIIGVGMGGMFVPMVSITARWFTARRSLMTAIVSSGAGIGMLTMPPLTAHLVNAYEWRTTFVIMGIIIFVVVLTAAQFLKRDPSKIGTVPYGESEKSEDGRTLTATGFSFGEALRTSQFWMIFMMVFWFGFFVIAVSVHIVPYAVYSGMAPTLAASILATSGALMVVGRIILGTAADRIGNRSALIISFILSTIALLSIVFMQAHWVFFMFAVLIGFSQGGIGTSQSPLVASLFGVKSHGVIYGFIGLGFTFGAALGPYVTGCLFDLTGSYNLAMIVCTVTSILALIFTLLIMPIKSATFMTNRL